MARALRVHLDESRVRAGDAVAGTVAIGRSLKAQRVTLELRLVERTATSSRVLREGRNLVLAEAVSLSEGDSLPFCVAVPGDAEGTWSTGTAQRTWEVAARAEVAGPDHHAAADLYIDSADVGTEPPTPAESTTGRGPVVAQTRRAERLVGGEQLANMAIGGGLVLVGAIIAIIGLTRLGDEAGGAFILIGFGAIMALVGMVIVAAMGRRSLRHVSSECGRPSYRPGDTIEVAARNGQDSSLRIGYQIIEGSERRLLGHRSGPSTSEFRRPGKAIDVFIHHAEWCELPPGDHQFEFVIPSDAITSTTGRHLAILHRIAIVKPGDEDQPNPRRSHTTGVQVG